MPWVSAQTRLDRTCVQIVSADRRERREARLVAGALGYRVRSSRHAEDVFAHDATDSRVCVIAESLLPRDVNLHAQWTARLGDACIPLIVVGNASTSASRAVWALKSGAIEFLCAPVSANEFAAALSAATSVGAVWAVKRSRRDRVFAMVSRLTPRERAVFELLRKGRLNKQIASDLDSQEATVKVHRSRLMRKLGARSLAQLLELGRELDVDSLPSNVEATRHLPPTGTCYATVPCAHRVACVHR